MKRLEAKYDGFLRIVHDGYSAHADEFSDVEGPSNPEPAGAFAALGAAISDRLANFGATSLPTPLDHGPTEEEREGTVGFGRRVVAVKRIVDDA